MAKYHISSKGEPALCQARPGFCPLAGEGEHFTSPAEAKAALAAAAAQEHELLPPPASRHQHSWLPRPYHPLAHALWPLEVYRETERERALVEAMDLAEAGNFVVIEEQHEEWRAGAEVEPMEVVVNYQARSYACRSDFERLVHGGAFGTHLTQSFTFDGFEGAYTASEKAAGRRQRTYLGVYHDNGRLHSSEADPIAVPSFLRPRDYSQIAPHGLPKRAHVISILLP